MNITARNPALDQKPNHAELPRRPRLLPGLPVLWRSESSVQIGSTPGHSAIIDLLTVPLARLVRELDGRYALAELTSRADSQGIRRPELISLLTALADVGLLVEAAIPRRPDDRPIPPELGPDAVAWQLRTGRPGTRPVADRADAAVRVHGGGRLAVAVACLLAASGVGRVSVCATGTVCSTDLGTGYLATDVGRERRSAARDAVLRANPTVIATEIPQQRGPDLVVLADSMVAEPSVVTELVASRTPHLAAHVHAELGLVGPLVLPRRTSCLRCAELRRTDAEPCWPALAAQLASRRQTTDLPTAMATAGVAAGQVLHALGWADAADDPPATWEATLELDPSRGTVVRRNWQPHPSCGCGAG